MTAQDPKSRLPYIYAWLGMTLVIGLLIYLLHLV